MNAMNLKKTSIVVAKIATLTFLLFVLFSIDFLGLHLDKSARSAPFAHLLMSFLDVLVLSYLVIRSRWIGWRLVVTVFFTFYGVKTFLAQIETVVFLQYLKDIVPVEETRKLFLNGAIIAAIFAPLIVSVHGKMRLSEALERATPRLTMPTSWWLRKTALVGLIYVVVYFAFGAFVAMPIGGKAFQQLYGGLQIPVWFLPFQIVRGMVWAALAIPVIQMMKGRLWEAGLTVALLFSVLIVSQLLPPNEYMPDRVRLAHFVEVTSSNFLFGWIVVWILGRPHKLQTETSQKGSSTLYR